MQYGFGERLKRLRKNAGITQAEVAKKLDKSASAVRMWESGANEPDMNTLVKLSMLFDCSLDYLLCRDLFLKTAGAVRVGVPVFRLSSYSSDVAPEFYKSIPSDYLNNGGSFFMILNDTAEISPLVPRNALVLLRRQDACLEGQLCFVRFQDGFYLRRVNFFDGGALLTGSLGTVNPVTAETDSVDFEIIGVAEEYSKSLL